MFVSSTPTASPDLLRHAHCHTCATERATGAARATRMPARLLAQLAGTWLKSHRSSAPCTPQPAALTWRGKTAKIPAAKAVLELPSARLLRRAKRDVFCVSQPNFPRCLASSQAHLLPPAFVFLPGARREGITPGSAAGRARTGAGPSSTSPRCTPPVTPAAPQELSILVLGKQQEGACLQHRRARRQREPSVRTRGKVCSFSKRLSLLPQAQAVRPQSPCQGEETRRAETARLFCPTLLQSDFSCRKLLLPGGSGSSFGAEMELSSSPSEQGLLEENAIRLRAPAVSDSWGCCAARRALEEHPHCGHFTLRPRICRLTSCVPP